MSKIAIFGGRGTAICIAEQIVDSTRNYSSGHEFIGMINDDEPLLRFAAVIRKIELQNHKPGNE